jgi:hypothetical protein
VDRRGVQQHRRGAAPLTTFGIPTAGTATCPAVSTLTVQSDLGTGKSVKNGDGHDLGHSPAVTVRVL